MSKELYNQIIDEVYNEYLVYTISGVENGFDKIKGYLDDCLVEFDGYYEHFSNPSFQYGYRPHTNEEFVNKCKINSVFSERWGLKIEERELSLSERYDIMKNGDLNEWLTVHYKEPKTMEYMDKHNIPKQAISLTYNNETITVYG